MFSSLKLLVKAHCHYNSNKIWSHCEPELKIHVYTFILLVHYSMTQKSIYFWWQCYLCSTTFDKKKFLYCFFACWLRKQKCKHILSVDHTFACATWTSRTTISVSVVKAKGNFKKVHRNASFLPPFVFNTIYTLPVLLFLALIKGLSNRYRFIQPNRINIIP